MRFSSFTYLVGQGLHNLKANKMMTLASMGVLIVCMILVGAAFLFGANIDSMVAYIGEQNETVAFINDDADTAAVEEAIRSIPHVAGVEFISKDQMLDEYSQRLEGYTNLKEMFQNDNPLLANYVVRADDPANISSVAAALQNVDGVRAVNSPQAMSDLFVSLQKAVTYVCYGLVIVLAIVSVVVISNTIRLTVFARRKEINIMKFVGATNAFIRLPFFVEGMTVGAISGVLATVVVGGAYYGLEQALLQPEALWLNEFTKCMWPFMDIIWPLLGGFVLFGVAIGGVGCASSIRKHLKV